ncbi:di-heme-cytochrome C peroxidase [Singulisphaera acidiphila]|nr:di-heme-cytochrome C peroxidase [Singulisphaera acidiphila]
MSSSRTTREAFGMSSIRCISVTTLMLIGTCSAYAADLPQTRNAYVATQDPFGESVTQVVYLDQNWSPKESLEFYFTSQGSQLIPYEWFLALEQPGATTPFRDNQNILKYRYLPQNQGPMNPDGLPVGFVAGQGVGRRWLGMSCAACHTAEIRLGTTGYRVDGAPAQADAQAFLSDLSAALRQTLDDPAKFDRFATNILVNQDSPANRAELRRLVESSAKTRSGYNQRNFPGFDPARTEATEPTRFGRLDAVDAIVNEVYWHAVKAPESSPPTVVSKTADAPVSYPFLWDTPQHDRVQWLGIAKSGGLLDIFSLSRNVGEVLGVFGDFTIPNEPSLLTFGYPSSVKFSGLEDLEDQVKNLWSPLWPEDFPKIDQTAAAKGAKLYRTKLDGISACIDCHAVINRTNPHRSVKAIMKATGTDSRTADNFFNTRRSSGKLAGANVNFVPFTAKVPPDADADTMLTNVTIGVILGRTTGAPPDELSRVDFQGERLPAFTLEANLGPKYKARPLNGIWATAPYLHNGSVPNLDALLRTTPERPKSFSIGVRSFDPVRVGYLTEVAGFPHFEVFNPDGTPIVGNSNAGHEFGVQLDDEQRRQLIEYLKSL